MSALRCSQPRRRAVGRELAATGADGARAARARDGCVAPPSRCVGGCSSRASFASARFPPPPPFPALRSLHPRTLERPYRAACAAQRKREAKAKRTPGGRSGRARESGAATWTRSRTRKKQGPSARDARGGAREALRGRAGARDRGCTHAARRFLAARAAPVAARRVGRRPACARAPAAPGRRGGQRGRDALAPGVVIASRRFPMPRRHTALPAKTGLERRRGEDGTGRGRSGDVGLRAAVEPRLRALPSPPSSPSSALRASPRPPFSAFQKLCPSLPSHPPAAAPLPRRSREVTTVLLPPSTRPPPWSHDTSSSPPRPRTLALALALGAPRARLVAQFGVERRAALPSATAPLRTRRGGLQAQGRRSGREGLLGRAAQVGGSGGGGGGRRGSPLPLPCGSSCGGWPRRPCASGGA